MSLTHNTVGRRMGMETGINYRAVQPQLYEAMHGLQERDRWRRSRAWPARDGQAQGLPDQRLLLLRQSPLHRGPRGR